MSFIQKFGFWIGIMAVCLSALLIQLLVVKPMSVSNTKLMEDLDQRRKKLQTYVNQGKRGELKNKAWIEAAQKQAEKWEKERERCADFFKTQDTISSILTDANGREITTKSRWVAEFKHQCNQIEKGLENKNIQAGENVFAFQRHRVRYERQYPKEDEMPRVTRTLHVLRDFIRILSADDIKTAAIKELLIDDDAKGDASDLPDMSQEGVFEAHPYTFVVEMEFERLLYLMRELLKSKLLDVSIERVQVSRSDQAKGEKSNVVTISIVGRYLDYNVPKADGEEA